MAVSSSRCPAYCPAWRLLQPQVTLGKGSPTAIPIPGIEQFLEKMYFEVYYLIACVWYNSKCSTRQQQLIAHRGQIIDSFLMA